MIWNVNFFHHAQGMDFPDKRNFGEWEAANAEDAIRQVMEASFKGCSPSDAEYIKGCLSARMVLRHPHPHAPRTDDVVLVKLADIPKLARVLCNRILEPDMRHEEEVWEANKEDFIKDIEAILKVCQDEKF